MVSSTELRKKQMPEASDNGSQPYSRADRYGEMAGSGLHGVGESLPMGRRHCLLMSLAYQQGFMYMCRSVQPLRSPQGDNCMAGYLCLMPIGIPSDIAHGHFFRWKKHEKSRQKLVGEK